MNIKDAVREIESHKFTAYLNAASDLNTFFQAMQIQKASIDLFEELDDLENQQFLLNHILDLSERRVDPRYENQWDTPLAVYLWLLNLKDLSLARIAATVVLQVPQCWWAKKIANYILFEEYVHNKETSGMYCSIADISCLPIASSIVEENILVLSFMPEELRFEKPNILENLNRFSESNDTKIWANWQTGVDRITLYQNTNSKGIYISA